MRDSSKSLDHIVGYAKKYLMLSDCDEVFVRNGLMDRLGMDVYDGCGCAPPFEAVPSAVLKELDEALLGEGLCAPDDFATINDVVMGMLEPPPSVINAVFSEKKAANPTEATDWLYETGVRADYIKKEALDKNPRFEENGLIITINKTKPEFRDPKKAQSGNSVAGGYPKCTICAENEGFGGRLKRNLRKVDITLDGEKWFWQYSPYGYFNHHGIAVNYAHTPMHVDVSTVRKLLDFTDQFPHYFIGCNAALPRIGGSVLAHDHFQGGLENLPLHEAPVKKELSFKGYENVKIGILDWPGSAVRIESADRKAIEEVAGVIIKGWGGYENVSLGIIPADGEDSHSAVSPTVRKYGETYKVTMILRNNVTTEEYPDGVFHAHPEFHVIKKESIGLIEAQGLFILPGRLESELDAVCGLLARGEELPEDMKDYGFVFGELKHAVKGKVTKEEAWELVKKELGSVCYRILENTAVFKKTEDFLAFLKGIGITGK